jgi:hypothetical protein
MALQGVTPFRAPKRVISFCGMRAPPFETNGRGPPRIPRPSGSLRVAVTLGVLVRLVRLVNGLDAPLEVNPVLSILLTNRSGLSAERLGVSRLATDEARSLPHKRAELLRCVLVRNDVGLCSSRTNRLDQRRGNVALATLVAGNCRLVSERHSASGNLGGLTRHYPHPFTVNVIFGCA